MPGDPRGLGIHTDVVQHLPYLYTLGTERDQAQVAATNGAHQREHLVKLDLGAPTTHAAQAIDRAEVERTLIS